MLLAKLKNIIKIMKFKNAIKTEVFNYISLDRMVQPTEDRNTFQREWLAIVSDPMVKLNIPSLISSDILRFNLFSSLNQDVTIARLFLR